MKASFKYISITLIFVGVLMTCFQMTIIHLSKDYKLSCKEISAEDIDDSEDDTDAKKTELEDEYNVSEFNHQFHVTISMKITLQIKELILKQAPILSINTPPPKYL